MIESDLIAWAIEGSMRGPSFLTDVDEPALQAAARRLISGLVGGDSESMDAARAIWIGGFAAGVAAARVEAERLAASGSQGAGE